MEASHDKSQISVSSAQTIPSRTEAHAIAEKCKRVLKEQFGAKEVYLFGSVTKEAFEYLERTWAEWEPIEF